MPIKMVTLCVDDHSGRRLNLVMDGQMGYAFVAGSAPPERTFEFSLENLGWVSKGLTYQAWGEGGHLRASMLDPQTVSIEFKSGSESTLNKSHISKVAFRNALAKLSEHRIAERLGAYLV